MKLRQNYPNHRGFILLIKFAVDLSKILTIIIKIVMISILIEWIS